MTKGIFFHEDYTPPAHKFLLQLLRRMIDFELVDYCTYFSDLATSDYLMFITFRPRRRYLLINVMENLKQEFKKM